MIKRNRFVRSATKSLPSYARSQRYRLVILRYVATKVTTAAAKEIAQLKVKKTVDGGQSSDDAGIEVDANANKHTGDGNRVSTKALTRRLRYHHV